MVEEEELMDLDEEAEMENMDNEESEEYKERLATMKARQDGDAENPEFTRLLRKKYRSLMTTLEGMYRVSQKYRHLPYDVL